MSLWHWLGWALRLASAGVEMNGTCGRMALALTDGAGVEWLALQLAGADASLGRLLLTGRTVDSWRWRRTLEVLVMVDSGQ